MKPKPPSRTYPSLKSAAAGLHLPLTCLRWAKGQNCPAIRANGSVNHDEFITWWVDNEKNYKAKDKLSALKIRKLTEEVRRLKLANDECAGTLVSRELVCHTIMQFCSDAKAILRQEFENTLPVELVGLELHAIREKCKVSIDKYLLAISKLSDAWPPEL